MDTITPSLLDFANHRADATENDIRNLCEGVKQYGFNSAFVNPVYVTLARELLSDKAKVGTVISFPLGADELDVKVHAIREAVSAGADELDIVPNISPIREGNLPLLKEELTVLTSQARSMRKNIVVKFIIETGLFLPEHFLSVSESPEIQMGKQYVQKSAEAIVNSGANFIKLCSGMGKRGVSVDDVTFIRSIVGPTMNIKGAGGVDTKEKALTLFSAGANRLGTSRAVDIITS